MFKAVNPKVDIPKLEQEQLDFWRMNRIFQRSMQERESAPRYVTYEGPPTVNGDPGVHHVLARAFKDIFPRYKTMRGYYALRKGGWDTHGLPVELAIEKELGFKHKHEIEDYGVAAFNEKARNSVLRNIGNWERFTERIAYWTDLDNPYVTFTNDYIESEWWILKQFWEKELLYKGLKVVPYCPRCGTPLSSAEVALGYEDVQDPSVFVRFPLKDKPGVYFLVWTTTPWTLPANVALAVGENIDYVQVEGPVHDADGDGETTEKLILAADLMKSALIHPDEYKIVKRYKGKDLLGMAYNPLYTFLPVEGKYAYVIAGDFVSTEDGSGIVHIAPAFGVDDMNVAQANDLPVLVTINSRRSLHRRGDRVSRHVGQGRRPGDHARPAQAGVALQSRTHRTYLPVLLALWHAAALLRPRFVVFAGVVLPRQDERTQPVDQLGAGARQRRTVRQLAGRPQGLGDRARALLGHAAADLAGRSNRRDDLRRQRRRTERTDRTRLDQSRPAPPLCR